MNWETSFLCCLMQMCLAAAKEISCYLYRQWSEPQAHLPITLGSLQMTGWFAMCGSKDCRRTSGNCLKMQPVSYIFMINLVSIPSGKIMSMVLKKKIYVSDRNCIQPDASWPTPWIFHICKWDLESCYILLLCCRTILLNKEAKITPR